MVKRKKKRGARRARGDLEPAALEQSCAICGAHPLQKGRCEHCGSASVSPCGGGDPLVQVAGRIVKPADEAAAAPPLAKDPPPQTALKRDTAALQLAIELPSGQQILLRGSGATEILSPENRAAKIDPQPGVAVAAIGKARLSFSEDLEGLREAAVETVELRAHWLALGPDSCERVSAFARELRGAPPPSEPKAAEPEPKPAAPPWEDRLPDDLRVSVKKNAAGEQRVCLSVGKALFPGLLAIPWVMLMLGSLGGIATWQTAEAFSDSPFVFLAGGLTISGLLAALLFGLWVFKRTTVRVDPSWLTSIHWPLPWPLPRRWEASADQVASLKIEDFALQVQLISGETCPLVPVADLRQLEMVEWSVGYVLGLQPHKLTKKGAPPAEDSVVEEGGVRRPLKWAIGLIIPVLFFFSLIWVPSCQLTVGNRVWTKAREILEGCPAATQRLGTGITWALGQNDSYHLSDGRFSMAIKGDQRRGRIYIQWRKLAGEKVRLTHLVVDVGDEHVCGLCCKAYGDETNHY